jgi:aminopeptidase
MFDSTQLERYAEILVWAMRVSRSAPFAPGEAVMVRFDVEALPLAEALYPRLLQMGANPVLRLNPTSGMERDFHELATFGQLQFQHAGKETLLHSLGGLISLLAPGSLNHLSGADPENFVVQSRARKPMRDILDAREQAGAFGWTLCLYPTQALAVASGQTRQEYARQIHKACGLGLADPLGFWHDRLKRIRDVQAWLDSLPVRRLHVEAPGVDLELDMGEHRRWLALTGHNIPSFEVYTSPDWRGTRGRYLADLPSFRGGQVIKGVGLTFEQGRVVRLTADQGASYAAGQLAIDEGAGRVGEFSLTDRSFSAIDRFMAHTLYDENYGGLNGNCHLALGSSYPMTYSGPLQELTPEARQALGFNTSGLHWDLINTQDKRVTARLADGSSLCIYENGSFNR